MKKKCRIQGALFIGSKAETASLEESFCRLCPSAETERVKDTSEAVGALLRKKKDVVFIDHRVISRENDFHERLLQKKIDVPVVVIVRKGREIQAAEAIKDGAYDYIVKGSNYRGSLLRLIARVENYPLQSRASGGKKDQQIVLFHQIWKSQKWWQGIIDAIKDYIFVIDDNYRILRTNEAFSGLFNREPADIIMTPYYELYGMDRPHEWCISPKDRKKSDTGPVEIKIGDSVYLMSSFPIFHDRHDAVVYIMKDITETRRLKDQIYHMDKLSSLGTLTSGVAHEINNPLTGIIGYTEMLLMNDQEETTKKYLGNIYDSAIRCKRIVENMLTFSRQKPAHKSHENINDIVDKTIELHEYWLRSTNIEVVRNYGEIPFMDVDRQQMQQVILNLLINAEHAISGGERRGRIEFRTEYDENSGSVSITVSDNGSGIPSEVLPKIFDPFFTTKPVNVGTGLGLSIAHGIISEMGGTIEASSSLGKGTDFIITLPNKSS